MTEQNCVTAGVDYIKLIINIQDLVIYALKIIICAHDLVTYAPELIHTLNLA